MARAKKYQYALNKDCPYMERFGCSLEAVKAYSAKGWNLDNTEEVLALIASQPQQPRGQPPGERERQPVADGADDGRKTREKAPVGGFGLADAIDRLAQAAKDAHTEMEAAKSSAEKVAATKRYTLLVKEWRDTAKSNPEIEESNKQTVKLSELKQTLSELFQKLRQDLDMMPKRIALELIGKDEIGIREVLQKEAEQIVSSLYQNKYLEQE